MSSTTIRRVLLASHIKNEFEKELKSINLLLNAINNMLWFSFSFSYFYYFHFGVLFLLFNITYIIWLWLLWHHDLNVYMPHTYIMIKVKSTFYQRYFFLNFYTKVVCIICHLSCFGSFSLFLSFAIFIEKYIFPNRYLFEITEKYFWLFTEKKYRHRRFNKSF